MNNAEKFQQIFGLYAEELWAKPVEDFLEWLNAKAQSEQNYGEWINASDGYLDVVKCNICGKMQNDPSNFCPYCGAWMKKGEQDEL